MNKLIIITVLFFSHLSQANVCSHCSDKKEPIRVCFVEKGFRSSPVFRPASLSTCGYSSEKYFVNGQEDIKAIMNSLKTDCQSIEKLVFFGHGSPGVLSATGLNTGTSTMWKDFSCVLDKDARVLIEGCNVGKGCKGDMLLKSMAENLFSTQAGSIRAPTFYASSILPGIIPHFSLNGKFRKVDFDPTSGLNWSHTGLALGEDLSAADSCKKEILDLVSEVNLARARAERKNCAPTTFHMGEDALTEYQSLANGLAEQANWNYHGIKSALFRLDSQLETLKKCKKQGRGTGGKKAHSAIRSE